MGSVFKNLFGGGKSKVNQTPVSVPIKYGPARDFIATAGKGSVRVSGDGTKVDVRGSSVPANARKVIGSISNQRGRLNGMMKGLRGNNNAFIQARVRPLEQALDENLAQQSQDFTRRGIFGSLSANEQTKSRFLGEQAISDERAKATDESISKLFDAEALMRGLNQDQMGVAETLMRDELSRLGISLEALQLSIGDQKKLTEVAGTNTTVQKPMDILGGIGKIMDIAKGVPTGG